MNKTNGCDWSRARNVVAVAAIGLYAIASAAQEPKQAQALPFIPSASDTLDREGFMRVINHSTEAGEVRIDAIDDDGESYGPIMLSVGAGEAVHFTSNDLENGNAEKGLSDGVGQGEGDWRLTFSSELDIEVLSYVRTAEGFFTSMHDTAPSEGGVHRIVFINPGSNSRQASRLRLINPGEEAATVSISGVDDQGDSPESEVTTTIPAGAARTYTAAGLESGGEGLEGALGDGTGKWRLTVESSQPLVAMSLLTDPMGYLTNLSTTPGNEAGGVQFMPSASDTLGRQGFVRVVNRSAETGEVRIDAFDDEGGSYGPVVLSIDSGAVVHFNSDDLEDGNAAKGLSSGVGPGEGAWRVELSSELDIEVLSYVRTSDGFLTSMHDTVPSEGGRHWVAFFNPGSNSAQVSLLRLINQGEEEAEVSIVGVDDRGNSPGSEVTTTISAGASRTFTAAELESGGEGLGGALGDGEGKWRLTVTSAQPLVVMSLLSDPMGYLTNLSTAPGRKPQGPPDLVVVSPSASNSRPVAGAAFTLSATVRNDGGAPSPVTVLRYYRSSDATVSATDRAVGTDAVVGLAASGSASASVELTAPSTPGTHYYGACVDAVAEEIDATNNCSTAVEVNVQESESESVGQPDLIVAPPTVSDSAPAVGATFTLSVTVSNAGDGTAPAAMLRWYRSSDATITTSDTPAGADEVAELGGSGSGSKSVELTAPATPGTYYYGACVDAVPGESDTTNNCSSAVQVSVPEPEPEPEGEPDLSVPAVSAATSPGGTYTDDSFTLSATVRNDGDAAAAATTLRWYRSTDATITTSDTEVGTDDVAGLAAAASGSESVDVTAPSTPGTYYYGACVDAVAEESDTTNNCSASSEIEVLDRLRPPELVVASPSVSDDGPVAGETFTLSSTVRNDGAGDSAATTLRYYRSTDATITTADTEVGTDAVEGLAASASSDESVELTAPATAGAYYYGACVDDVAEESDTTNNCSTSVKVDVEAAQSNTLSVEVTAPQEWAPMGDTVTYMASVVDSEGEAVSGYTFSWTSSDTTKATVDSNGVVTALAVGETTISASASATTSSTVKARTLARDFGAVVSNSESTMSGSLKMNVVKPVARIVLSPSSLSFDATGESEIVTATLYDSDDNEMSPTYWGWGSADREVARVYSRIGIGVSASVSSIGEGSTTVSLSANGTKQSMNVTVTLPTARVDIGPRSLTFEALGDTKSVTVKVLDENGDEDEDATWSYFGAFSPCCHPDIADPPKAWDSEKTDDGLNITAEGPGSGQITISSTDVESAILGVTIYMKPASVVVSPSLASLEVDETTTLTATIEDANGNSIHVTQDGRRGGKVVYWDTSNDTVATVEGTDAREDHNTGATATVTAVAAGSATITGRWGSSVRGTATVTVTDGN